MKPRNTNAAPSFSAPVTVTFPAIELPSVTVQAAPPALVTKRNADHLGMTGEELVRVLRAMRADPRPCFRDAVIAYGKSFRAAPPDAIVAYLRAAPMPAAEDEGGDDLLHELGYQHADKSAGGGR